MFFNNQPLQIVMVFHISLSLLLCNAYIHLSTVLSLTAIIFKCQACYEKVRLCVVNTAQILILIPYKYIYNINCSGSIKRRFSFL